MIVLPPVKGSKKGGPSLVLRVLPCRKTGRESGRSDHMPRDVLCGFMRAFDN